MLQVTYSSTLKPSGTINSDDSVDCRSTSTVDLAQLHLRTLVVSSPPWMVSPIEAATGTAHLGWKGAHIAVDIASGGGGTIVSIVPTSFPQSQVITGPVTIRHRKSSSLASTQAHKHTSPSTRAHQTKHRLQF